MSAFNTVSVQTVCPVCRAETVFEVQFKYGDTWQYQYKIGDDIRWDGNDYGKKSSGIVRVEGIGRPCPNCAAKYVSFIVTVIDNKIASVEPAGVPA